MSQMQLMRLFGPYVWGALVDRGFQRNQIIQLAGGLSLIGFTSFFWFNQLSPLLVGMTVLAFFWSAALPLVETLTFDYLKSQAGRYGQLRMWGSVGFIVAVISIGWLMDRFPESIVLWSCWVVLLGIFGLSFLLPVVDAHPESNRAKTQSVQQILFQPHVLGMIVSCLAMSAAHGVLYVFYSIQLADHGYSKTAIGILWSLGVIAEILFFMAMPKISLRWSLRTILLTCYWVAAVRFLLIAWAIDWLIIAFIAQLMHGLTFGAHHAASISAINRWFPGANQARGQAIYSSLSFGAGGLIGNLLSGYLWENFGGAWAFSFSTLFALLAAFICWRWLDAHEGQIPPKLTTP